MITLESEGGNIGAGRPRRKEGAMYRIQALFLWLMILTVVGTVAYLYKVMGGF